VHEVVEFFINAIPTNFTTQNRRRALCLCTMKITLKILDSRCDECPVSVKLFALGCGQFCLG
jgi:hypothetical protein